MDSHQVESLAESDRLRTLQDHVVTVKVSGRILEDDQLLSAFGSDVALLSKAAVRLVLVHGGGPQINARLKQSGLAEQRIDGLRVTDSRTMEIVNEVLSGEMNARLAAAVDDAGGRSQRIHGADDGLLCGKALDAKKFGLVGEITAVNSEMLRTMYANCVPVVSPVAAGENGEMLNVNADSAAAGIAGALAADEFLLLTDTDGIQDAAGQVIPELNELAINEQVEAGVITDGMLPKAQCAIKALESGVRSCRILNGTTPHILLLALLSDDNIGSNVIK